MNGNPGPVFVTGYQRSGTTLLGTVMDRHPNLAIFVESFFIPKYQMVRWLYSPLSRVDNAVRLAKAIVDEPSSQLNKLEVCEDRIRALKNPSYGDVVHALLSEWAASRGKARWGDKSPGYITRLPLLLEVFPNARFVHIIRDGRDVFLSVKRLGWMDDAGKVGLEWDRAIRQAQAFGADPQYRDSYHELRYEDLITRPEEVVQGICDFIDEPYSEELLSPGQRADQIQQLKDWPKVHDKIDSSNVARWREKMSAEELTLFESAAAPLLTDMGYPPSDHADQATVSMASRKLVLSMERTSRRLTTLSALVAARLRRPDS